MRHIVAILVTVTVACGVAGLATAHPEGIVLPSPGLTPASPFYFLDRFGEWISEFFTFNAEGKARLQIKFAWERLAEIQVLIETRGVEAPGLEVARERLSGHLSKATDLEIIKEIEEFEQRLVVPKVTEEIKLAPVIDEVLPISPTAPLPVIEPGLKTFLIEGDDAGIYPSTISAKKGDTVRITFKTRTESVYYGGLDFRGGVYFNTGTLLPGGAKTVEFIADQSFDFKSYWPASGVLKATGRVIVE